VQASSWYPLTLAILTTMSTMDVRSFNTITKAAPYPLACVLFAHYTDMKEHGFRIAPVAYGGWARARARVGTPVCACVRVCVGVCVCLCVYVAVFCACLLLQS